MGTTLRMMQRARGSRRWGIGLALAVVCCLVALAAIGRQAIARAAIIGLAPLVAHVHLALDSSYVSLSGADFSAVRVTSLRDEPIASIDRLSIRYNVHDLLAGRRLFGLEDVAIVQPRVTIIRRPDGTFNIPVPNLRSGAQQKQAPLQMNGSIRDGSIDIIDEGNVDPRQRHLYVRRIRARGAFSIATHSSYTIAFQYGERADRLYAVNGVGDIDATSGYMLQRWRAPQLPIAGAVDFAIDSPSLHVAAGELRDLDARIFGFPAPNGMQAHVAASAELTGARVAIGGLTKPIENVHGRIDVDEGGLLVKRLDATIAGIPVVVSGGAVALRADSSAHPCAESALAHPCAEQAQGNTIQVRLAVRGSGQLTALRSAFAQGARLPVSGQIAFGMLAEGPINKPLEWISLQAPHVTYASSAVDGTRGLVAFDGQEADIADFATSYHGVALTARGRAALQRRPNAVEMLLVAQAPAGAIPYEQQIAPDLILHGLALATAMDPKTIALRGVVAGASPAERIAGTFDVAADGTGSIGPLLVSQKVPGHQLYVRAALNRPRDEAVAVFDARNFDVANLGRAQADGIVRAGRNRLGGQLSGVLEQSGGSGRLAATIGGTPSSPRLRATVALDRARYAHYGLNGSASIAFANGTLAIRNALAQLGPAFVSAEGTVRGLRPGQLSPHYDIDTRVQTADAGALLAFAQPKLTTPVEGSLDANLHVNGTLAAPAVSGNVNAPEGLVNGLAFRELNVTVGGTPQAIALSSGHVTVGSTAIAFSGATGGSAMQVAVAAPHANLADFNDYFDEGDMFAGTGHLALDATINGAQLASSTGNAHFTNARFRRIDLGTVAARWSGSNGALSGDVAMGGPTGEITATGTVSPSLRAFDVTRGRAIVRHMDLATWLPMLGFNLPLTGRLDADATVAGSYPNLSMQLHSDVYGGTLGRMPIERFELAAAAANGRGSIQSAVLQLPSLTTTISGSFGLHPNDPLALLVTTTSPDIGTLAKEVTGKPYDVGGSFESALHVNGTRVRPQIIDDVTLRDVRYGKFVVPSAHGEVAADSTRLTLRNAQANLQRGSIALAATMPIRIAPAGVVLGDGPISGSLVAQDVEASNLAAILPKGTHIGGRIDGTVRADGTLRAPQLSGALALTGGAFIGPMEKAPIKNFHGQLVLSGTRVTVQNVHADVGGGSLAAAGWLSITDARALRGISFAMQARADNAHLEMPAYFQGNLDGTVSVARSGDGPIAVGGDVAVSSARIPLSAFYNPSASKGPPPHLPPVAFDRLHVTAGRDVRVQSGEVDVGGTGSMTLGGTLSAPTLAGAFDATGGSVNFYRTFTVNRGSISFAPSSGLLPYVDAVASTYIADPATAIRLHITGPVSNMNLGLASDPSYNREQILGLLTGLNQIGAVRGVSSGNGASGGFSLPGAAQNLALGQANTVFTRQLLEPLSASVGGALGFNDLQITNVLQGGMGLSAAKAFGKNVTAGFNQTFGTPKVQSFALEAHPNIATALRMRLYSTSGASIVGITNAQQPDIADMNVLNLNPLTAIANPSGTGGLDFSFVNKFP